MPSSSKKQHNFMEAIAHSPSFAKKVGVSQSVGKDFSAADKGRKFMHGGAIAKQNTQHGKMDIPFSSLKRFAGMKSGGMAKRYVEGGDVDSMSFGKAFRQKLNELGEGNTFTWKGKSYSTNLAKSDTNYGNEGKRTSGTAPKPQEMSETPGAVTGRRDTASKYAPSSNRKQQNAETLQAVLEPMVEMAIPAGKLLQGGRGAVRLAESRSMLQGMPKAPPKNAILNEARAAANRRVQGMPGVSAKNPVLAEREAARAAEEAVLDTERASAMGAGYKKGGSVNKPKFLPPWLNKGKEKAEGESKAMDKKEGKAGEKAEKYAKGGSVMRSKKDIARDQMAMAPYAKGGGVRGRSGYAGFGGKENPTDGGSTAGENPKIQKRGLTEGRVIKMATGGSVKMNRGGGIESRGKTRGKMC
jgi:hypothetical protein